MKHFFTLFMALAALAGTAQESYTFGYCSDDVSGIGLKVAKKFMGAAIRIPSEDLVNNGVTAVKNIQVGIGECEIKNAWVFVSTSLATLPVYKQEFAIDKTPGWHTVELTEAVQINASQDLYVGYYLQTVAATDYPIGVDGSETTTNEDADLIGWADALPKLWGTFNSQKGQFGAVCVRTDLIGTNLPMNQAKITGISFNPAVMRPGQPLTALVNVQNVAANNINSLTFNYAIGENGETQTATVTLEAPIVSGKQAQVPVNFTTTLSGWDMPFNIAINRVNDVELSPESSFSTTMTCTWDSYPRTMVVEEATCLKCGFCPRGYVGLEMMKRKYTDGSYIGISAHNAIQGEDPMACISYLPWRAKWASKGNPMASVNRMEAIGQVDPNFYKIEEIYAKIMGPAIAQVTVSSELTDTKMIRATAATEFALDNDDARYALTFVLTEDDLGPYEQSNYFNYTSSMGLATDFESKPNPCDLIFNDIAREIVDWQGIMNSVPGEVKQGVPYTYTVEIDPKACEDLDNVYVTAMLIDVRTGEIINANQAKLGSEGVGINPIIEEDCAAAEYYNLQGQRVSEPGHGIFIKKVGNKTTKVVK